MDHILKVQTGRVGSSVFVTVSRTSSIGETSSSSLPVVVVYGGGASKVPMWSGLAEAGDRGGEGNVLARWTGLFFLFHFGSSGIHTLEIFIIII